MTDELQLNIESGPDRPAAEFQLVRTKKTMSLSLVRYDYLIKNHGRPLSAYHALMVKNINSVRQGSIAARRPNRRLATRYRTERPALLGTTIANNIIDMGQVVGHYRPSEGVRVAQGCTYALDH
ncbi:hypothetical protein RR48_06992 [Papilio machaon]|uniref:Uncharacterized protein n=1 Tax=Papilio machaon TaxID=76193 RepID=A0A194R9D3_PAPMA|nr:hypothetical protein RR48_06992 [Papilio machaon]